VHVVRHVLECSPVAFEQDSVLLRGRNHIVLHYSCQCVVNPGDLSHARLVLHAIDIKPALRQVEWRKSEIGKVVAGLFQSMSTAGAEYLPGKKGVAAGFCFLLFSFF